MKIEKDALREQLQGSKFRLLNEFLYTTDSKKALDHFRENEQDFDVYHQGFRNQAIKWEVNPLDVIIGYIYKHFVKVKKVKKSKKKYFFVYFQTDFGFRLWRWKITRRFGC